MVKTEVADDEESEEAGTEDGDAMEVLPCHSGCHALQHARAHPRPGPQGVGHQDRAEAEAGLPMMRVATILRGAAPGAGAGLGAGLHLLAATCSTEALGEGATRVSNLAGTQKFSLFSGWHAKICYANAMEAVNIYF